MLTETAVTVTLVNPNIRESSVIFNKVHPDTLFEEITGLWDVELLLFRQRHAQQGNERRRQSFARHIVHDHVTVT